MSAQLLDVLSNCIWVNHYDKKLKLHYWKQKHGTITASDLALFAWLGLPLVSEEPRREKMHD